MWNLSFANVIEQMMPPALILGGGTAVSAYLEKKDRVGLSIVVKIGAIVIFLFCWLVPTLEKMMWLFRGAMSLPLN
jgi:hypothetical protein